MSESNFHVRMIPANLVEKFWKFAEPYIKRALEHSVGEFKPADVEEFCKKQLMQLWLISENERIVGAATTQIINYPQRRHCRIAMLGGSRAVEWTSTFDKTITEWAKSLDCVSIEAFVRKGYVPILAKYGGKHHYSVVIRKLD